MGNNKNLIADVDLVHVALDLHIAGAAPLMMHAPTLLDPQHPTTREVRSLTSKTSKNKTIADHERVARLEWEAGLYHDDDIGPFLPATNIKQAMRAAAGKERMGAGLVRGLTFADTKVALNYEGPRDIDGLYEAGYRDTRAVKNGGVGGGRVMRTRPCFEDWSLQTRVYLNPHELDVESFARFVAAAQRYGLGDYRPEFGLFSAQLFVVEDEALEVAA